MSPTASAVSFSVLIARHENAFESTCEVVTDGSYVAEQNVKLFSLC